MIGEGNGTPLQYSCLENPMEGGAWCAAVHGVAESQKRLSNFTFTFYCHALEKEMATHSSVLAWRIPGMGEPGGLPFMGLHRVGHDWSDLAAAVERVTGHLTSCDVIRVSRDVHLFQGQRFSVTPRIQKPQQSPLQFLKPKPCVTRRQQTASL